jgi:hypothetical protein
VATGDHPDVKLASTNCHNGKILHDNYMLDRTGQEAMSNLQGWRDNVTKYTRLAEATEKMIGYTPMGTFDEDGFLIKFPPSPPLSPNEATMEMLHEEYKEQVIINQALVDITVEQYSECFVADRSDETICGLSRNEVPSANDQFPRSVYTPLAPLCSMQAPNPWIATDGTPCRGYATLQAREEDYCGCARAARCTALRPTHPRTHAPTTFPLRSAAQTGTRTSTRWRPLTSSGWSCSSSGRTASTTATRCRTARRTPRARSARV